MQIPRYICVVSFAALLSSVTSFGQDRFQREGVISLVPSDAILCVERRGHDAVKEAMLKSNFRRIWSDPAIAKLVVDSRDKIEELTYFDAESETTGSSRSPNSS